MRVLENYINGAWTRSTGATSLDVRNPATGEVLAKVPLSPAEDVDAAVRAAQAAFPAWSATPPVQRARYLFKLKALFDEHKEEIAAICTSEHGKTLAESRNDFGRGIENVEHAAGIPTLMMGQSLNDVAAGIDSQTIRQPLGVFGGHHPLQLPPDGAALVPAVRHRHRQHLRPQALRAGAPLAGAHLPAHPPDRPAPRGGQPGERRQGRRERPLHAQARFKASRSSGRATVARHVYRSCAETGKRVQALGGAKNFIAILPDAEIDKAIANAADSAYGCSGQRCLAASVVVAVGSAYERVREGIVAAAKAVKLGAGNQPGVTMGPGHLGGAPGEGRWGTSRRASPRGPSSWSTGAGPRSRATPAGFWVGPTVFDDVKPGMTIATEEIFGPVHLPHEGEGPRRGHHHRQPERVRQRRLDLHESGKRAREFQLRIQAGMVGVNIGVAAPMAMFPFGGQKGSFFGDIEGPRRRPASTSTPSAKS